jgi:hypothetical protein
MNAEDVKDDIISTRNSATGRMPITDSIAYKESNGWGESYMLFPGSGDSRFEAIYLHFRVVELDGNDAVRFNTLRERSPYHGPSRTNLPRPTTDVEAQSLVLSLWDFQTGTAAGISIWHAPDTDGFVIKYPGDEPRNCEAFRVSVKVCKGVPD